MAEMSWRRHSIRLSISCASNLGSLRRHLHWRCIIAKVATEILGGSDNLVAMITQRFVASF